MIVAPLIAITVVYGLVVVGITVGRLFPLGRLFSTLLYTVWWPITLFLYVEAKPGAPVVNVNGMSVAILALVLPFLVSYARILRLHPKTAPRIIFPLASLITYTDPLLAVAILLWTFGHNSQEFVETLFVPFIGLFVYAVSSVFHALIYGSNPLFSLQKLATRYVPLLLAFALALLLRGDFAVSERVLHIFGYGLGILAPLCVGLLATRVRTASFKTSYWILLAKGFLTPGVIILFLLWIPIVNPVVRGAILLTSTLPVSMYLARLHPAPAKLHPSIKAYLWLMPFPFIFWLAYSAVGFYFG